MQTKQRTSKILLLFAAVGLVALAVFLFLYFDSIVLLIIAPITVLFVAAYFLFQSSETNSPEQFEQIQHQVEVLLKTIGDQEQQNKDLQAAEAQFRGVFEQAPVGSALVETTGQITKVNRALCNIVGYSENELTNTNVKKLLLEDDIASFDENLARLSAESEQAIQIENRIRHKQGHALWSTWSVSRCLSDLSLDSFHYIFQLQGISHRKPTEQKLVLSALHDVVTGLPNRVLFMDHLQVAFKRAKARTQHQFAVLFIEFDRFKFVSNDLSDTVGDQLLIEVARRLESVLRENDTIARLSGDEFAVLLDDTETVETAINVAEKLNKEFAQPFYINGHEAFTSLCTGIAMWSREYDRPEYLLRDANSAFHQAKRLGRARYEVFDPEMHKRVRYFLQLENDLRRAIESNEFCLHYQPIIELKSCRLVGFEALIRWIHPVHGLISPMEFISIAEETGLITPIGNWVLQEACQQLSVWQNEYKSNPNLWVSVNVSGKQLVEGDLVKQIADILQQTDVSPQCLKLEITESAMINNIESAVNVLAELKKLGVQLSVDDFGTGYSSLSNLHRLPLTSLKIDRSFVTNMQESDENWEIIKTIIVLGQSLNLEVIAEGVETGNHVVQLQNLDCEFGQGYYFAQPLDTIAVDNLLKELQSPDDSKTSEDLILKYFDGVAA